MWSAVSVGTAPGFVPGRSSRVSMVVGGGEGWEL